MAKSPNQKLKLLIIKDFMLKKSDEKHPVTIPQIIEELARYDIKAERKSLYDDLEALRLYGLRHHSEQGLLKKAMDIKTKNS